MGAERDRVLLVAVDVWQITSLPNFYQRRDQQVSRHTRKKPYNFNDTVGPETPREQRLGKLVLKVDIKCEITPHRPVSD